MGVMDEIEKLLEKLESYEDVDPVYLHEDMRELRHRVMHIHQRLELSLDILIGDYILDEAETDIEEPEAYYKFRAAMSFVLVRMDFLKKVEIAEQTGKLTNKEANKLRAVNTIRRNYSHPNAYAAQIYGYREPVKYLEVLKTLDEAYMMVNEIFRAKRDPLSNLEQQLKRIQREKLNKL